MRVPFASLPRRRFLSGMAVLGATPLYSRLAAFPPFDSGKKSWTGDNFEEAHERQRNPYALIRRFGPPERQGGCYDVIVVGGGISGLTVAYQLACKSGRTNILLLEREQETGGVSKSGNWKEIEYSLGAAYMVDPAPWGEDQVEAGSQEEKNLNLLKELKLDNDWRKAGEKDGCVFTNDEVVPELDVYSEENSEFFTTVAKHDNFPSIPPDEDLVKDLDVVSFKDFLRDGKLQHKLYGKTVGPISPKGWESIEYYFWGAFATNTWETSAYHGLNFFAAEFAQILVFPGGNAFIAKRLDGRVRSCKREIIRTGEYVLQIRPARDKDCPGYVVLSLKDQKILEYHTRSVVFASPLFLAKSLIPDLADDQRRAIESLDYRSFVVANVLLQRRMDQIFHNDVTEKDKELKRLRDGYELRRVHGVNIHEVPHDVVSNRGVFSDVVVADFAIHRAKEHAVLTVYRPYPYAHGRDRLRYLSYEYVENEIRKAVVEGFRKHGLREDEIVDIRLTRWGHPMIIPRPGQLADDTMKTASKPSDGLFFSHTDTFGAPAIENALAAAYAAVQGVTQFLKGSSSANAIELREFPAQETKPLAPSEARP